MLFSCVEAKHTGRHDSNRIHRFFGNCQENLFFWKFWYLLPQVKLKWDSARKKDKNMYQQLAIIPTLIIIINCKYWLIVGGVPLFKKYRNIISSKRINYTNQRKSQLHLKTGWGIIIQSSQTVCVLIKKNKLLTARKFISFSLHGD